MTKVLIVLPAYNEEKVLEQNTIKLYTYCQENLNSSQPLLSPPLGKGRTTEPLPRSPLEKGGTTRTPPFERGGKGGLTWQILIVDNNSSDKTQEIGENLDQHYEKINYLRLATKGKGIAIRSGWLHQDADIYVFMDYDLSTDLSHLKPLIGAINCESFDIAIGSRKLKTSREQRSVFRKIFSWGYNLLVKLFFNIDIKDMACGFKAVNKKIITNVVPEVKSNSWFFDSELLILARKKGYKIKEIPINWREAERESRLGAFSLSWEYLKNIIELRWRLYHKNTKYHKDTKRHKFFVVFCVFVVVCV